MQDPSQRRRSSIEEDDDGENRPQKKGINPIFIGIGAVILSLVAVYFFFSPVSQKTIDAKLTEATTQVTKVATDLTEKFNTLQASITDSNTKQINSALANVPTAQSVTEAKNAATQAQAKAEQAQTTADQSQNNINSFKIPVDNSATVKQNSDDIATLTKQVVDLTAKVNAIPTPTPTSTSGGITTIDKVVVSVEDIVGLEMQSSEYNFLENEEAIKLKITNNNATAINGLRLYIYLYPDETISTSYVESVTMGGDKTFTVSSWDSDEYKFKSPKLNVAAGKSVTYYLTPSILMKPFYPYLTLDEAIADSNVPYTIEGNIWYLTNNSPSTLGDLGTDYLLNTYQCGNSKLNKDVTFSVSYEVIDFNIE